MRIVFLGPPGAGKGTQAVETCESLRIPHISTGNLLREEMAKGSRLGKTAKGYIEKGQLVPDGLVVDIVAKTIKSASFRKGYLLDGFPRNLSQARALDKVQSVAGLPGLDLVVYFDVPDRAVVPRLTGRRVCRKCACTVRRC